MSSTGRDSRIAVVGAGRLGLGPSEQLSHEETIERIPTIEPEGLRGRIFERDRDLLELAARRGLVDEEQR